MQKPAVFLDADVIFAGAASPSEHGASLVVLRLGEITLLDCVTSEQAIVEVERNLAAKLPAKLPDFQLLVRRCLRVVPNPDLATLANFAGQADPKDLPLLAAAVQANCRWFLTFNTRHYFPAGEAIVIQRPGEFLRNIRGVLNQLASPD
ncbi:MAG: PIN domain-containing protein [Chloroflexi bacterium]|nr:MAG: PIN domain-containing protein [Chloroflexota bacterium]